MNDRQGGVGMPRFVTLGPGTNHDVVARDYLAFHGLGAERLRFVATPDDAVVMLLRGDADFLILCSVHPDAMRITGQHSRSLFPVDAFISPSKTLAVLTRSEVSRPRSLGLFAPTRDYVNASRWEEVVIESEGSIVTVGEGLLRGDYDSALVYLDYAERHPGRFRVDEVVGSPDDAWVVFGRQRAYAGRIIASLDSLVGRVARTGMETS